MKHITMNGKLCRCIPEGRMNAKWGCAIVCYCHGVPHRNAQLRVTRIAAALWPTLTALGRRRFEGQG